LLGEDGDGGVGDRGMARSWTRRGSTSSWARRRSTGTRGGAEDEACRGRGVATAGARGRGSAPRGIRAVGQVGVAEGARVEGEDVVVGGLDEEEGGATEASWMAGACRGAPVRHGDRAVAEGALAAAWERSRRLWLL